MLRVITMAAYRRPAYRPPTLERGGEKLEGRFERVDVHVDQFPGRFGRCCLTVRRAVRSWTQPSPTGGRSPGGFRERRRLSDGRFYLSDPGVNKVYQLDRAGKILRTFGRLKAQKPGSYDPETLMSPGKLANWSDPEGNDRLLVVDQAGPTNTSEWSAEGKLLRQFVGLQTNSNNYGYIRVVLWGP